MAPPRLNNDNDGPTASQRSIYSLPLPESTLLSNSTSSSSSLGATKFGGSKIVSSMATQLPTSKTRLVCSSVPGAAASVLLRRRLILPTVAIPTLFLFGPAFLVFFLSSLTYFATDQRHNSLLPVLIPAVLIIFMTTIFVQAGFNLIIKHAPNEKERRRALDKSRYALPFWSLLSSIAIIRVVLRFVPLFTSNRGASSAGWFSWISGLLSSSFYWTQNSVLMTLGFAFIWSLISVLVTIRYYAIMRCSTTPLKLNPFYTTLQKIRPSKQKLFDTIANALDRLSARLASTYSLKNVNKPTANKEEQKPTSASVPSSTNRGPFLPKKESEMQSTTHVFRVSQTTTNQNVIKPFNRNFVDHVASYSKSSFSVRYVRPGILPVLGQIIAHAFFGLMFAHTFVHSTGIGNSSFGRAGGSDVIEIVIKLSCVICSVFEILYICYGTNVRHELDFCRYSPDATTSKIITSQLLNDIMTYTLQRAFSKSAISSPFIAALSVAIWSHSATFPDVAGSMLTSFLSVEALIIVMAAQDVFSGWSVCQYGMNPQQLLSNVPNPKSGSSKFLVEDLFIQSILMGDGTTVDKVIATPQRALAQSFQDSEILRNEECAVSFAQWLLHSSTNAPSKLSDDILRMCLLESVGGGGSSSLNPKYLNSLYFGEKRHSNAIRQRLDLSAVKSSPGKQPIVVPLVRALCAFAGGTALALIECFGAKLLPANVSEARDVNPALTVGNTWRLPPGSLGAAEYAIIAASRFVVMNLINGKAKRQDHISLLLPCVLQSAHTLRRGLEEYSKSIDSLDCDSAILACDSSAKLIIRALTERGDATFEDVLFRRGWKNDMRKWLSDLNYQLSETVSKQ